MSKKSTFLVGLNLGYSFNIDGEYRYEGSASESVVVRDMYTNDLAFLTSDYFRIGGELNFSTMVARKTALFISTQCQYLNSKVTLFKDRVNITCSVGIHF